MVSDRAGVQRSGLHRIAAVLQLADLSGTQAAIILVSLVLIDAWAHASGPCNRIRA